MRAVFAQVFDLCFHNRPMEPVMELKKCYG